MEAVIQKSEIPVSRIHNTTIPNIPACIIRTPEINLSLRKRHKTNEHPFIFQELEEINIIYPRHTSRVNQNTKMKLDAKQCITKKEKRNIYQKKVSGFQV